MNLPRSLSLGPRTHPRRKEWENTMKTISRPVCLEGYKASMSSNLSQAAPTQNAPHKKAGSCRRHTCFSKKSVAGLWPIAKNKPFTSKSVTAPVTKFLTFRPPSSPLSLPYACAQHPSSLIAHCSEHSLLSLLSKQTLLIAMCALHKPEYGGMQGPHSGTGQLMAKQGESKKCCKDFRIPH
eukprot:1157061-Pelagomonas_calceolata.AAC.3